MNALVNAICTVDPGAERSAAELAAESGEGRLRSDLHGKLLAVKDNIEVEGLPTTAGSRAMVDNIARRDAPVVARLRRAGLVIVGKSNLSEWAGMRDEKQASGWSGYGGLTRNPYALNRTAGGSSAGSGAAVAARLADVALGTETDGSITWPAAFNGCVGVKPTVGLLPTRGVIPISVSQDTVGPITSTVADAAAMLSIMAADGRDFRVDSARRHLEGVRIGVPRGRFWGVGQHAEAAAERALSTLSNLGATIVDGVDLQATDEQLQQSEMLVLLAEMRAGLDAYLRRTRNDGPRSLAQVVDHNRANAELEFQLCGQGFLEAALSGPQLGSEAYLRARADCIRASRHDGIDRVLRRHDLEALVSPPFGPAYPIDTIGPEPRSTPTTTIAAMAGYPLITVPSGMASGLPLAVSFWGTAGSDSTLIGIAAAYESARVEANGPIPEPGFLELI